MASIYSAHKGTPLEPLFTAVFRPNVDPTRTMLERIWFRNILYYMGEQWIEWLTNSGVFQRRYMYNPNIPTPVSNIIKDYIRSTKSLILNKDYAIRIWPNSKDVEDKDAAELGETYLKWADSANDEAFLDEREKIAIWMLLTGTSFARTLPNKTLGDWAFDTKGKFLEDTFERTQNIIPFNVIVDQYGETLRDKRYIGIKSLQPREWIEDTFNVKVTSDGADASVNYQRKLMHIVSSVSPWKGGGLTTQLADYRDDDYALLYELEFKPTKEYPKGRYALSVGGKVIADHDRLPIPTQDGYWDYSITDFHYHYTPGRFWSEAGVDDLISPQNAINQIDQALEMNRKGLGRPTIVTTKDMEVRKLNKDGQSFLALEYDALLSGGVPPRIYQGKPLPNQILDERKNHQSVAQDAAGDPKHVLRGQSPSGNASGILVDILREAAEQGHVPDIMRFFRSLKRVYRKRLVLAQELSTKEQLIKVAGKGADIKIVAFKGAKLKNNTDVRLELNSGLSSTQAGRTQALIRLLEAQFFGDVTADPDLQQDLMRRLGLGSLRHQNNIDVLRAEREHSYIIQGLHDKLFLAAPTEVSDEAGDVIEDAAAEPEVLIEDPLFMFDNHVVHLATHRKFVLSEEFTALKPALQVILLNHMKAHQFAVADSIAQQQQQQTDQTQEPGKTTETPPEAVDLNANPEEVAAEAIAALGANVAPSPITGQ